MEDSRDLKDSYNITIYNDFTILMYASIIIYRNNPIFFCI